MLVMAITCQPSGCRTHNFRVGVIRNVFDVLLLPPDVLITDTGHSFYGDPTGDRFF